MRKFLMWFLAATLVVAMAMPVLADVNISGSYRLRGVYYEPGAPDTNLQYYDNRLRFEMTAKVSDNLSMFIQADTGLGYIGTEGSVSYSSGSYTISGNPLATQDSYDGILSDHYAQNRGGLAIAWQRAYFKYDSPIGTFQVGRQWAFWAKGLLVSANRNRIKYIYSQPNYFLGCGLDKWDEARGTAIGSDAAITDDTDDLDHYFVFGGFNIAEGLTWTPWFGFIHGPGSNTEDYDLYYTVQGVKYVKDKLTVNAEFDYKWGTVNTYPYLTNGQGAWYANNGNKDVDISAYAFSVDASYDLDFAKVGAEFTFFSGESAADKQARTKTKLFHSSYWYAPFVIFGELPIGPALIAPDGTTAGNHHELANCYFFKVYATASPMENLEVTGAIGYIQADEARAVGIDTNGDNVADTWYDTGHDNMGWEFDLIATYKITDNLSYSVVGAYFTAGDYFDQPTSISGLDGAGYTLVSSTPNTYTKADDAYAILHQIMIHF